MANIDTNLYSRQGQASTNFEQTLPAPQSDLAHQLLKDPYNFDFLTIADDAHERAIQRGLIEHIRDFMLELGVGFAFVGENVHLDVGGENFKIGFTDKTWASKGDSIKSESINNYLPKQKGGEEEGRITTNWQRAVLPLKEIEGVDLENMDSQTLSLVLYSDCA